MTTKRALLLLAALGVISNGCSTESTTPPPVDSSGAGPFSAPYGAATTLALPGPPVNVAAVPGDRSATVTWNAPSTTGGSAITGYTVVISPTLGSPTITMHGTLATVAGLTNGTAYVFRVFATNAVGDGALSPASAPVVPVVAPAVTALTIVSANPSFPLDRTLQLAAIATLVDGTKAIVAPQAIWTSGSPDVVRVSGGKLSAAPGAGIGASAVITATYGGVTATPVTASLLPASSAIGPGFDDDPFLAQQWHLHNTGQTGYAQNAGVAGNDIAAAATYRAGVGGRGVKVAVVDSGLEIAHEDLAGNLVAGSWNFLSSTSDPTSTSTSGDHGTSVAGLIAAVRGNHRGGMGVAPAASLNGYNYVAKQNNANFVASMGAGTGVAGPKSLDVSIFNQSFGVSTISPFGPSATREAQYLDGVTNLRDGLGAVYVKSAGNGFIDFDATTPPDCTVSNAAGVTCENASMDPYNTLPMNIVVGALDANGRHSSYSSAGASIWVSAPGGEYGLTGPLTCHGTPCPPYYFEPAMITTDQSGCSTGYATSSSIGSPFDAGSLGNGGCNYTNGFNGTSSAAPVVSGVVALLLEANPSLTWRDVKYVLASTARQVDAAVAPVTRALSDGTYAVEPGWISNGAGYRFHDWYGFGAVDVDAAIAMAMAYVPGTLPPQQVTGWIAGSVRSGGAIPDDSVAGALGDVVISRDLRIEAVQVRLSTDHSFLGELGVELTSPAGTRSVLLNALSGFGPNTGTVTVQLSSNAFLDESSAGSWILKVVDVTSGRTGSLVAWQVRIYGH